MDSEFLFIFNELDFMSKINDDINNIDLSDSRFYNSKNGALCVNNITKLAENQGRQFFCIPELIRIEWEWDADYKVNQIHKVFFFDEKIQDFFEVTPFAFESDDEFFYFVDKILTRLGEYVGFDVCYTRDDFRIRGLHLKFDRSELFKLTDKGYDVSLHIDTLLFGNERGKQICISDTRFFNEDLIKTFKRFFFNNPKFLQGGLICKSEMPFIHWQYLIDCHDLARFDINDIRWVLKEGAKDDQIGPPWICTIKKITYTNTWAFWNGNEWNGGKVINIKGINIADMTYHIRVTCYDKMLVHRYLGLIMAFKEYPDTKVYFALPKNIEILYLLEPYYKAMLYEIDDFRITLKEFAETDLIKPDLKKTMETMPSSPLRFNGRGDGTY